MKNRKTILNHSKSFLCMLLCLSMAFTLFALPGRVMAAKSEGNTITGSLNANVSWTYHKDSKKLVISGKGDMYEDPSVENFSPFNAYSDAYEDGYNEDVEWMLMAAGEIVIKNGITSIMDSAFRAFTEVTKIHIGADVRKIGANALQCGYSGCYLKEITVDKKNKAFVSDGICLYNAAMTKLVRCVGYDESRVIRVPSGVKAIAQGAFFGTTVKKVILPTTLTKISSYAFTAASVDSIVLPDSIKEINHAFDDMHSLRKIFIGSKVQKFSGKISADMCESTKIYFSGDMPAGLNINAYGKHDTKTIVYYPKNNKTWNVKNTGSAVLKPWAFYTPVISGLTNKSAGKLTVKWSIRSAATGYQIQYADNSKFTGKKTLTVKDASTLQKTISGLKKGKTCYVRMRAYKRVNATNLFTDWSAVKKLTISK